VFLCSTGFGEPLARETESDYALQEIPVVTLVEIHLFLFPAEILLKFLQIISFLNNSLKL
jgi:hypothetical protein